MPIANKVVKNNNVNNGNFIDRREKTSLLLFFFNRAAPFKFKTDIKIGKTIYHPLEQDSIDIIESLGGVYKGKLKMLMASMIGVDRSNVKNCVSVDGALNKYEPIFIFHKR